MKPTLNPVLHELTHCLRLVGLRNRLRCPRCKGLAKDSVLNPGADRRLKILLPPSMVVGTTLGVGERLRATVLVDAAGIADCVVRARAASDAVYVAPEIATFEIVNERRVDHELDLASSDEAVVGDRVWIEVEVRGGGLVQKAGFFVDISSPNSN